MPIRIGINALSLAPGRMGGVETYFNNLIASLQETDRKNEYVVLLNLPQVRILPLRNPNFSIRHFHYGNPSFRYLLRGFLKNTLGADLLARPVDRLGLNVIHHPFTILDPINLRTPAVLTFWDMQQEYFPEFFSSLELHLRKKNYRLSAEKAKKIITCAKFTKNCLAEKYSIDEKQISIIYPGIGKGFRPIDDGSRLEEIQRKYSLDFPFLYYPAATWPHKNHRNLLLALKILKETRGFDGKLVLTGIPVTSGADISRQTEVLGLKRHVRSLGYLPHEELRLIYNLARLLVFPSLFEGFGIPVVEAMACGCPVACANTTSLPEIVGDNGILFDPCSPQDIADKVWTIWHDSSLREELRRRGLQRSKDFDWNITARKTAAVYCSAAAD